MKKFEVIPLLDNIKYVLLISLGVMKSVGGAKSLCGTTDLKGLWFEPRKRHLRRQALQSTS